MLHPCSGCACLCAEVLSWRAAATATRCLTGPARWWLAATTSPLSRAQDWCTRPPATARRTTRWDPATQLAQAPPRLLRQPFSNDLLPCLSRLSLWVQVGQKYGLPLLSPVDDAGVFTDEAGPFAGLQVQGDGNDAVVKVRP